MRAKWQLAVSLYNKSMSLLRSRYKFDETMVLEFQETVDHFYDIWFELTSKDGTGNYMHMLATGHIGDQLTRLGNLYRYSQQGWEALNKKMKKIYFNQTALGGGCNGPTSKLLPIFHLFLREMYWRFGWAEDYFKNHVYPRVEGEEYCPLNIKDGYTGPTRLSDEEVKIIAKALVGLDESFDALEESTEFDTILERLTDEEYRRIVTGYETGITMH